MARGGGIDLQDNQSTLLPMWGTSFQGDSVFSLKQSAQRKLKISFSDETCQIDQLTSTDKGVGQPLYSILCGWILYQQGELQKPNQVDIFGQPSLEVCFKEEHDASYLSTMTSVKSICCQQPLPIAVNLFSLINIFVLVQAPAGTCIGSSTI